VPRLLDRPGGRQTPDLRALEREVSRALRRRGVFGRALLRTAIGAVAIALLALLVWPSTVQRDVQPHTQPTEANPDASAGELARLRKELANSESERERLQQAMAETDERVRSLENKRPQFWFEDTSMLLYRAPMPTR